MSNYSALKTDINNNIYENNTQQITGTVLNTVLKDMVNTLGAGYQFAGCAYLDLNPGAPDAKVFYLAGEGLYTNFDNIQVPAGKLGILKWDTRWHLETIEGLGGGGANLTGYISVASTDDLPDVGQPTIGYLCGTNLYLYVGEGGDTKEGKYQDCGGFRGPEGVGITEIEQVEQSTANGGRNTIRIHLSNGSSYDVYTRNGTTSTGLFPTLSALQAAYPSPVVGQYAFVGAGFPADIYVCNTAGTWTDSGADYDGDSVDLTDYATKAEVNQLEAKVTDLEDAVMKDGTVTNKYSIVDVGGRYAADGTYYTDTSSRGVKVVAVVPGASYKITTRLRSAVIPGVIYTSDQSVTIGQNLTTVLGTEYPGTGTAQNIEEQPLTIPNGTTFIIAQSSEIAYVGLDQCVMETSGGKVSNVYTKTQVDEKFSQAASETETALGGKVDKVVGKGLSTNDFTNKDKEEIGQISDMVFHTVEKETKYSITNGGWYYSKTGEFNTATGRGVIVIPVVEGAEYKITSVLSSTLIAGAIYTSDRNVTIGQNLTTVLGYEYVGTGQYEVINAQQLTIPVGTTFIIAQSAVVPYPAAAPFLDQNVTEKKEEKEGNVYTKEETDTMIESKADAGDVEELEERVASLPVNRYGVKWSVSDFNDLGSRVFDAVGLSATIGVGSTDGSSDFDNIWPWAGMKRCNIKVNANGAKIVTFEGETGFALDGSNGDVFVRIPKFKTNHYKENGYEFVVIGDGYTHPAFIEDGAELDEIFIGAFEASGDSSALFSKGGVIPANNITGASFLAGAKAKGANYSLYDMRCVDALWRLMAVEYGCRNSNRILGWGYSDFVQPIDHAYYRASVAAQNTNTIVCGNINSASGEKVYGTQFAPGNIITICDGTQTNIVAQRVITASTTVNGQPLSVTFDGDPIDVSLTMFIGNGPALCNYCETIPGDENALSWHTGRANRQPISGSGLIAETTNPCRYRWVENPVGSAWHFLPDVTFNDLQMYVCPSMKDYEIGRITPPYSPIGALLPEQGSNGNKTDINTVENPNYWLTSLLMPIFSKGNCIGGSFDTVHDGTLTSQKGFGGYYYLATGQRVVVNGGGFDHLWRSNILTHRASISISQIWYLYGARLMFKNI